MPLEPPGKLILTRESRDARYAELVARHLQTLNHYARDRMLTPAEMAEWNRLTDDLSRVDANQARTICLDRIELVNQRAMGRTFNSAEQAEWDQLTAQCERVSRSLRL